MKTRSVLDSGVVGETVLCLRPRPREPRDSAVPTPFPASLVRLDVPSGFRGLVGASVSDKPFDGLSEIFKNNKSKPLY